MKRIWPVLLLTACSTASPTTPDGACVAAVNVDGVIYGTPSVPAPDPSTVSPEPYVTVTLDTGCLDQGEPPVVLGHGESNFLDVGTTIHTVDGFEPGERLVFWSDVVMEWQVLAPYPESAASHD